MRLGCGLSVLAAAQRAALAWARLHRYSRWSLTHLQIRAVVITHIKDELYLPPPDTAPSSATSDPTTSAGAASIEAKYPRERETVHERIERELNELERERGTGVRFVLAEQGMRLGEYSRSFLSLFSRSDSRSSLFLSDRGTCTDAVMSTCRNLARCNSAISCRPRLQLLHIPRRAPVY